jgi:hypothetical protein
MKKKPEIPNENLKYLAYYHNMIAAQEDYIKLRQISFPTITLKNYVPPPPPPKFMAEMNDDIEYFTKKLCAAMGLETSEITKEIKMGKTNKEVPRELQVGDWVIAAENIRHGDSERRRLENKSWKIVEIKPTGYRSCDRCSSVDTCVMNKNCPVPKDSHRLYLDGLDDGIGFVGSCYVERVPEPSPISKTIADKYLDKSGNNNHLETIKGHLGKECSVYSCHANAHAQRDSRLMCDFHADSFDKWFDKQRGVTGLKNSQMSPIKKPTNEIKMLCSGDIGK